MKLNHSVLMASVLGLGVGVALAIPCFGSDTGKQSQATIETTHAILPITIDQAVQAKAEQPAQSQREQLQKHNRTIAQTQEHANSLVKIASHASFDSDSAVRQHATLKESLGNLKQEHAQLTQRLTQEQQNSVRLRNADLMQAHDRLQNLLKEMEREFSDSVLHVKDVAEQARGIQREMKAYQKGFRALSKDLGMAIN